MAAHIREKNDRRWAIGNELCEMEIALDAGGAPILSAIRMAGGAADWAPPAGLAALGPAVEVAGAQYKPGATGMSFAGAAVEADAPAPSMASAGPALRLAYRCENGLEVHHYLSPAPVQAVWRTWTRLVNPTGRPIDGITRFDALNLTLGVSPAEPQAAYLLGWLDTPRADAPGRPPIPFKFAGWIPKLMYGGSSADHPSAARSRLGHAHAAADHRAADGVAAAVRQARHVRHAPVGDGPRSRAPGRLLRRPGVERHLEDGHRASPGR